jgi:hypothetical protein
MNAGCFPMAIHRLSQQPLIGAARGCRMPEFDCERRPVNPLRMVGTMVKFWSHWSVSDLPCIPQTRKCKRTSALHVECIRVAWSSHPVASIHRIHQQVRCRHSLPSPTDRLSAIDQHQAGYALSVVRSWTPLQHYDHGCELHGRTLYSSYFLFALHVTQW